MKKYLKCNYTFYFILLTLDFYTYIDFGFAKANKQHLQRR